MKVLDSAEYASQAKRKHGVYSIALSPKAKRASSAAQCIEL